MPEETFGRLLAITCICTRKSNEDQAIGPFRYKIVEYV